MEKGFQLLPMVFVCVASEDDMSRVGFGRSEAVSGIDDPRGCLLIAMYVRERQMSGYDGVMCTWTPSAFSAKYVDMVFACG